MTRKKILKFPVAYCLDSLKIEHIRSVKNGKECNCICLVCSEPLIAKNNLNNKNEAHFSHKPESGCETNVETYLHLIIKEILPELNKIKLPCDTISIGDLLNLEPISKIYKSENLIRSFEEIEVYKESKEIVFKRDEVRIEKTYQIDNERIKPDIIIKKNGVELFIEPFLSHQIDQEKLSKIKKLDISCVAINLLSFLRKYKDDELYTLDELKDFIINDLRSKKWIWLRNKKRKSITKTIVNRLNERLKDYPNFVDWDGSKTLSILTDKEQLETIEKEIEKLKDKKSEIQKKISSTYSFFEFKEKRLLQGIKDILNNGKI